MNRRSIYELTVDKLRTIIIDKKIDTEAVRYKHTNKKTNAVKGEIKKSKTLLIKHILVHSENGEIYTLGDDEIYQEKKKEPRKEKKIEPPTPPEIPTPPTPPEIPDSEIPDLKIQEPPEIPDSKIPDSKIPYSKIPEETIESIHKKLNETINKLQISTRKTESLCMHIWLFYILVGIYCVLNYLL